MATQVQFRGGSTTEHGSFTGAAREVTVDTTKNTVVVHDGSTAGGHALATENSPSFTGSATFAGSVVANSASITYDVTAYNNVILPSVAGNHGLYVGGTNSAANAVIKGIDGSATFGGNVRSGGDPASAGNTGVELRPDGSLVSSGPASSITLYETGNTTANAIINSTGSATFAGGLLTIDSAGAINTSSGLTAQNKSIYGDSAISVIRGYNKAGTVTSDIFADGSSSFAEGLVTIDKWGQLNVNTPTAGGYAFQSRVLSGNSTCIITGAGSATFAGNVNAPQFVSSGRFLSTQTGTGEVFNANNNKIRLYSNGNADFQGSATFEGNITKNTSSSSSACIIGDSFLRIYDTPVSITDYKITLENNGSASFANSTAGVYTFIANKPAANAFCVSGGSNSSANSPNFYIHVTGSASFNGAVSAQGSVLTSDQRFKENITDANPQLADVTALGNKLRNWDWTDDAPVADKDTRFLGLVAQEAETVCPGIVTTIARTKDGAELTPETTDEDGTVTPATYEQLDDSYKGIKNDILIMKLLGAVAELSAKVAALESA